MAARTSAGERIGGRVENVAAASFPVLVGLTIFAAALAVLLSATPLWETPDTSCKTVWTAPSECSPIAARREHWIVVVVGLGVLALAVSLVLRKRRAATHKTSRLTVAVLSVGVLAGLAGAAYLTIGENYSMCGSTLSRVDPYGEYSPGRPEDCAPSYAESRTYAWLLGAVAAGSVIGAAAIEARKASREPSGR